MTPAPAPNAVSPILTGLVSLTRRLADDYGITVIYTDLPEAELLDYDQRTGVILLRNTAEPHQQAFGLSQIWWLNTCGLDAAPAVRRERHLQLVPLPRAAEA